VSRASDLLPVPTSGVVGERRLAREEFGEADLRAGVDHRPMVDTASSRGAAVALKLRDSHVAGLDSRHAAQAGALGATLLFQPVETWIRQNARADKGRN
jgi:hypothetical protein